MTLLKAVLSCGTRLNLCSPSQHQHRKWPMAAWSCQRRRPQCAPCQQQHGNLLWPPVRAEGSLNSGLWTLRSAGGQLHGSRARCLPACMDVVPTCWHPLSQLVSADRPQLHLHTGLLSHSQVLVPPCACCPCSWLSDGPLDEAFLVPGGGMAERWLNKVLAEADAREAGLRAAAGMDLAKSSNE